MIGPMPLIFSSDPRTALQVSLAALALMLLWLVAWVLVQG
ncbi:MAG: DUF131 domain-containing protein [Methanosarcinales archaeon]|nr:DUF131 domain-containing protein [Methanosarcinales archaeon]